MRLAILCVALGGLLGANVVLAVNTARERQDAAERLEQVERIAVQMRDLLAAKRR